MAAGARVHDCTNCEEQEWVEFSGTSQQVEQAFHTELHYYKVGEQQYVANATDMPFPMRWRRFPAEWCR